MIKSTYMSRVLAALLLCVGMASCSQDDADIFGADQGNAFPPGKYPLMLTATVDGMKSRSSVTDSWIMGDRIGVRIGDDNYVGCYELNASGSVKQAIDSVSWKSANSATVTGWYPYEALTDTLIADQSKGFHGINFMRAVAEDQKAGKKVDMIFKHQMAMVSCVLLKGEGITEEDMKTAKVSYYGFTKASFSETEFKGDENGWIIPNADNTALLVPQKMAGKPFIKINLTVTVNGIKIDKEFIYIPSDDVVEAGTHYSYTITVKKDRIDVDSFSASWTDDGKQHPAEPAIFKVNMPENVALPADMDFSENVRSEGNYLLVKGNRFTISYEVTDNNMSKIFQIYTEAGESDRDIVNRTVTEIADDKFIYYFNYYLLSEEVSLKYVDKVQPGDYYYNNGTWGPLELRGKKTPIGVIFKAGPGSVSDEDNAADYGWKDEIHGYAVALHDATENMIKWGSNKSVGAGDANKIGGYDTSRYKIPYSGYNRTKLIKAWGDSGNDYAAVKAALEYEPKAPDKSSGWYLPSAQQLADIENLPDRAKRFTDVQGSDVKPYDNTDKYSYWSCLERSKENVYTWQFDLKDGRFPYEKKQNAAGYVRAVLTF